MAVFVCCVVCCVLFVVLYVVLFVKFRTEAMAKHKFSVVGSGETNKTKNQPKPPNHPSSPDHDASKLPLVR